MNTSRVTLLWCVLLVLVSFHRAAGAEVLICDDVGFFRDFFEEELDLVGNCDDPDLVASLHHAPRGIELRGFGDNPPIKLRLLSDTSASAGNITQFDITGHTGKIKVLSKARMNVLIEHPGGGSCNVIAKGGSRCVHEVTATSCPTEVLIGDRVCTGCTSPTPCADLGSKTFYVQGTPTFECDLTLQRVSGACRTCNGKSVSPKASSPPPTP